MVAMSRWERIAEDIRTRIRSGEYAAGDLLPSYRRLGDMHAASYGTVRVALMVLRTEGWVEGEAGVGVRVRPDHPS